MTRNQFLRPGRHKVFSCGLAAISPTSAAPRFKFPRDFVRISGYDVSVSCNP